MELRVTDQLNTYEQSDVADNKNSHIEMLRVVVVGSLLHVTVHREGGCTVLGELHKLQVDYAARSSWKIRFRSSKYPTPSCAAHASKTKPEQVSSDVSGQCQTWRLCFRNLRKKHLSALPLLMSLVLWFTKKSCALCSPAS
eukprot:557915-Amphidinium_carterae.1